MTLPLLCVLTYTPAKPGALSRLVDVGASLDPPSGHPAHGRYQVKRLAPSMRVLTWQREGARFDFSHDGGIRVWAGRQPTAAERASDCRSQSVSPLAPDDVAYLEAYLLWQNSSRSDPNAAEDLAFPVAPAAGPQAGKASARLRILHTEAATSFGGQEFCIYKEMIAMRDRGHHLELVCQPGAELGDRLGHAGFTVHRIVMDGPGNFLRGVAFVRRLLRRERFDVVNTHSRRDTVLAAMAARLAGTPLIVRTRHLAKPIHSLYAYTWLAHRVIAVSRHVRKQLLDGGARPESVATIHSPIVLPQVLEGACVRHELGLPQDALVVGCVAVMRAEKGHADLIDAFHRVSARFPSAHLVLVGDGMPLFDQLRAKASALGLAARVHFTGRRQDIGNVLMALDVFALPTHREALGTVFIEAAAMGVPVIGTDVGGVPETMLAGVTGLLVPPRDPVALAAALETLLADPAMRRRMGEAGRELIRGQGLFSAERTAGQVEHAYTRWLAELGGPGHAA